MYEVYIERSAERDLKRLSVENFHRMVSHIKALGKNPRPAGSRKIIGSENDWRIRVGKYRIIYEVDDNAKAVKVMKIRTRGEAYR